MKKNEGVDPKRSLEWVFTLFLFSVAFILAWGTHAHAASDDALVIDENGNVEVNGTLASQGRHQRNDDPEKTYEISPRYHLTITALSSGTREKKIPQKIFEALCADVDGCQVRLRIRESSSATNTVIVAQTISKSSLLYYSTENRHWQVTHAQKVKFFGNDKRYFFNGVDNDQRWNLFVQSETCMFSDGMVDGPSRPDKEVGVFLSVFETKNNRICDLTLID